MMPLAPIPGDPQSVVTSAAGIAAVGERLLSLAAVVRGLHGARWEGPAGQAFGEAAALVPPVFDVVARRHTEGARILIGYAAELDGLQRRCREAVWRHESAEETVVQLARSAWDAPDDASRAVLRDEQRQWQTAVARAATDWGAVMEEWRLLEERTARALDALGHDAIADSRTYQVVHMVRDTFRSVSMIGVVPTPLTTSIAMVPGALASTGDVVCKVFWDEGSWKEIGLNLALSRAGAAAGALKASAKIAPELLGGTGLKGALRAGAKDRFVTNSPWRFGGEKVELTMPRAGRHVASAGPGTRLLNTARDQVEARAQRAYLDDWKVATTNGVQARRLLLASWSIDGTLKAQTWVSRGMDLKERRKEAADH